MLTLEEFETYLESGYNRIACPTYVERNQVIEFLLSIGYEHGGSNVSRECLKGEHEGWWLYPQIAHGRIEFYGNRSEGHTIEFADIEHLINAVPVTQVDDLL